MVIRDPVLCGRGHCGRLRRTRDEGRSAYPETAVDRAGASSVRVNDQYRITFRFEDGHAYDVTCEDYH